MIIAFDLETMKRPGFKIPKFRRDLVKTGNRGDDKKKEYLDAKEAEHLTTVTEYAALSPATNQIFCYAYRMIDSNGRLVEYDTVYSMTEEPLIRKLTNTLIKGDQYITFNGNGFDIPCLMHRWARYNIPVPYHFSQFSYSGYHFLPHWDLMKIHQNLNGHTKMFDTYIGGSLSGMAEFYGLEPKHGTPPGCTKSAMEEWPVEALREYAAHDVELLHEIAVRIGLVERDDTGDDFLTEELP